MMTTKEKTKEKKSSSYQLKISPFIILATFRHILLTFSDPPTPLNSHDITLPSFTQNFWVIVNLKSD